LKPAGQVLQFCTGPCDPDWVERFTLRALVAPALAAERRATFTTDDIVASFRMTRST